MATVAARFAAMVDRTGTHHLWRGAVDRNGVPQMRVDGRLTTARRVAWELEHGPLDPGTRVHACAEDPRCVCADHLSVTEPGPSPSVRRIRRPRGDGSARQVRPGVWALTVTTPSQGRAFRTVDGDRTDAERELARLASENGQAPATLDALVHLSIAHLTDHGRSAATTRRYEQLWRTWLEPSIGDLDPDQLRPEDIEAALEAMAAAGQSRRSIHQAAVVLNTAYAWAAPQRIARGNPVLRCELPDGTTIIGTRRR
jgi:hypothetical protein